MVRSVIWVNEAQNDRIEILKYWIERNKSKTYSKKLNQLFKESLNRISKYPFIGKLTDLENVRIKIVRDYVIYYKITLNEIIVLRIWDSRQNPEFLNV